MPAQLVVVAGPDKGKAFPLKPGETLLIGRGRNTGAQLSDPSVSRVHCEVKVEGERAVLLDLASSTGTQVNARRVERHELEPDDLISVGDTRLRFEAPDEAEEVPVPAGVARPPLLPAESLGELTGCWVGRYQLGPVRARGQSGVVFQGQDSKDGQPVALKVFWPEFTRDPREVRRFIRAIKTMIPMHHVHLVRILNAGLTNPYCWLVMEYVDGKSAAEVIDQGATFPWQEALRVAVHVSRALVFAHFHQIIHRNVAPRNILVSAADGVAKLGDLLTAKAMEASPSLQVTRPGELVGDVHYMAPERTSGLPGDQDHRSDLYSLGATLYALLTGRPPLKGSSTIETLLKVRQEEPVSVRRLQPAVPEPLDRVVMKLLAKSPEHRYQTAAQLLAELECLAKDTGRKT
jgi:pSer/pThr/pTyr-binding forkhead associated (FHA) protein